MPLKKHEQDSVVQGHNPALKISSALNSPDSSSTWHICPSAHTNQNWKFLKTASTNLCWVICPGHSKSIVLFSFKPKDLHKTIKNYSSSVAFASLHSPSSNLTSVSSKLSQTMPSLNMPSPTTHQPSPSKQALTK